jgi:hypothetical protein
VRWSFCFKRLSVDQVNAAGRPYAAPMKDDVVSASFTQ